MAKKKTIGRRSKTQVHNTRPNVDAKVQLREHVLDALTPERAIVLDAFCGPGAMFDAVWKRAAAYVGCDVQWHRDDRFVYVVDNTRLLRCLDLQRFTVFDLDAFGSPWEQAIIIGRRRPLQPGEHVGVLLTEGDGACTAFLGSLAMKQAAGIQPSVRITSAKRFWDVSDRAKRNLARMMGGSIVKHWRADGVGAKVRYTALIIENGHNLAPKPPAK